MAIDTLFYSRLQNSKQPTDQTIDMDALNQWATGHNIHLSGITISHQHGMNCLTCTQSITQGDIVIRVPMDMMITQRIISDSLLGTLTPCLHMSLFIQMITPRPVDRRIKRSDFTLTAFASFGPIPFIRALSRHSLSLGHLHCCPAHYFLNALLLPARNPDPTFETLPQS